MKLEECLSVNNINGEPGEDQEVVPRRINPPPTVKRPGRAKTVKKPPTRGRGRKPTSSESSSDAELENHPPSRQKGRQKERRIIQSDSDEEPAVQKRAQAVRPGRATKIVQESSSSGKKRLSENNSF